MNREFPVRRPGCVFGMVAILSWILSGEAHAYIDPATGSMLLQVLVGGIVGGLFVLKTYWRRIRNWLTGRSSGNSTGHSVD